MRRDARRAGTFPLRVYRPLGARLVAATTAGVLTVLFAFLWLTLPDRVRDGFGPFQRLTLLAFFVLVLLILYGVFRTRVSASERGISVTNGFRRHDFDWAEVVRVALTQDRPWALVDLTDGSTVALMALQAADGPRAKQSTRELSAMVADRSTHPGAEA